MKRPRRRHGSRALVAVFSLAAVLVALGVAGGGLFFYGRNQLDPPDGDHSRVVEVIVRADESADDVIAELDSKHLIRSRFWFSLYARYKGLSSHLHPGQYRLDGGMGATAIISRLEGEPDVATRRLVLAEGLTAAEMAAKVEAADIGVSAASYLAEVSAGNFPEEAFLAARPPKASIEGFLFPDTYDLPATGLTAHALVKMQLDTFRTKAGPLLGSPPASLTGYQLLTLASVVEREAKFDEDRPLVAGVLVNRLNAGIPLQVDASVNYGNGVSGRAPTADELARDTPYNTYIHLGLPPTPIANPGVKSLQAAAHPAATQYLFYVSDGCGHNHYSTTAAEHDRLVQQYLGKPCT